jgi:type IV secretion system protein VirB5
MPVLERTDAFLHLAKLARNWQLVAFLLAIGNVVLASGVVRVALSSRFVPYLVEVDRDGNATYAGPIETVDAPEERLILQQLRVFVWNLRVVVNDPAAQQELIARAYALADGPLRARLDEHFSQAAHDPRRIAPQASRTVERITLLKLPASADTYQVEWTEATRDRDAYARSRERSFHGLLTVARSERLPREALLYNPLGLLVTEFTWTEVTPSP